MKKIFLVSHWTEGVTSGENLNETVPCTTKEGAVQIFKREKDKAYFDEITKETEDNLEYEFRDNGATCYGYITIKESNLLTV